MRVLDATFCSHIWAGTWSYLSVRSWMYHAFALLAVAGAAGVVWVVVREHMTVKPVAANLAAVRMTIFLLTVFALGLVYHAVTIYAAHGMSAVNGWYIDSLVAGEAVLWALGLMAFLPPPRRAYVIPLLALAFLVLDVFAMHIYLLPYYAGFIAHTQGNHLPALKLGQLASGGWRTLFERLAVNKPAWLSVGGIVALWAGYVLASCGTAAVAWRMVRRTRPLPDRRDY